ncbi:sensor histidine kinase [Streptomyces sp. NPDC090106]|uniref:sensor histidine kinase n=1 Tax=Streptomyces sp. NPDC090106 TaxID=3365946 RepID=UPI0038068140
MSVVAVGGTAFMLLRTYLVQQVDDRLGDGVKRAAAVTPERMGRLQSVLAALEPGDLPGMSDEDFQLFVYGPTGSVRLLPLGPVRLGPTLPSRTGLTAHAGGAPFTVEGRPGEASWRIQVYRPSHGGVVVGSASLDGVDSVLRRVLLADAAVMALALVSLGLLARTLIDIGLRPLARMEATADEIAAGDYTQRVMDTDLRTEPGRLGTAINAMLDRIEREVSARQASERNMRRFLADASHELRTPLTSIRGFAELASWGGGARKALDRVTAEAARMSFLVDDLLLLARLDESRPLDHQPVDLLQLAAELVRDTHLQHPRRTMVLASCDPDKALFESVTIRGDKLRLRQVLVNLLSNAVRYTPDEASITVRVGLQPGGTAIVEVADTGPGVAAEDAPYVFERFFRAASYRSLEGSGLGLAIARAIVIAHQGQIELSPTPGGGATFRVMLPTLSIL